MVHHPSIQRCPKPVALPIVFVPGIMGSRLRRTSDNPDEDAVWDPDRTGNAISIARADAARKREVLIGSERETGFNPDYLQVDYGSTDLFDGGRRGRGRRLSPTPAAQEKFDRNWGGLLQNFYGEFLSWLTMTAPSGVIGQKPKMCTDVHYEVWAYPYNWTDDNLRSGEKLAETVQAAIDGTAQKHAGTTVQVLKPVLITHSMGGLVARAYTQLHGGAGAVQGVIHGAMPTDGAPATYKRMLAGFEGNWGKAWVTRHVLGANQKEVTATAGNMPGALQLLPNQRHKGVDDRTDWLRCVDRQGKERWSRPSKNPYSEIYLNQSDWWRLIYKQYLNPLGNADEAFRKFFRSIRLAELLHARLGADGFHPNTRMFYADDPDLTAWDCIEWRQTARQDDPDPTKTVNNDNRGTIAWGEWLQPVPSYGPYEYEQYQQVPRFLAQTRYEIQDKSAPGDGTVHTGSGKHVPNTVMSIPMEDGFEHDQAFDENDARKLVAKWLFKLVEEQIPC